MSESLTSLTKNERMSESLVFLSESLIRSFLSKKRAFRWLGKPMSEFPALEKGDRRCKKGYIRNSDVRRHGSLAPYPENLALSLKRVNFTYF